MSTGEEEGAVLTAAYVDHMVARMKAMMSLPPYPDPSFGGALLLLDDEPKMHRVTGRERIRYNVALARDFWRSSLHGGFW